MVYPYQANPPMPEPDSAELAERKAWLEQNRADIAARKAAQRPMLLQLLQLGPQLRDMQRAADCGCSCHPRPADPDLHDGGPTCPCQLTTEERRDNRQKLRDDPYWKEQSRKIREREERDFAAAKETALALGATCTSYGGLFPMVVTGTVSGRAFYFRLRHQQWRIEIAGPTRPLDDPYSHSDPEAMVIAGGEETELGGADDQWVDPVTVMKIIVSRVRGFLDGTGCEHHGMINFCPICGAPAAEYPGPDSRSADNDHGTAPPPTATTNNWSESC